MKINITKISIHIISSLTNNNTMISDRISRRTSFRGMKPFGMMPLSEKQQKRKTFGGESNDKQFWF
jgi:hypothetical protein